MKEWILFLSFFLLGISYFAADLSLSYAEEDDSSNLVKFVVKFPNGDRLSLGVVDLVIYQDNKDVPFQKIEGTRQMQYLEVDLPLGHKYKIETYNFHMLSSTNYLQTDKPSDQIVDIVIPTSGGLKLGIFYKDSTPIHNAKVILKSHSGDFIRETLTDHEGNTPRMWVASTHQHSDYYVAEIILGENIVYEHSGISLQSGSHNIEIITPWPSVLSNPVIIDALKTETTKLSHYDGDFQVKLTDENGVETISSLVKGSATFPEMHLGKYDLVILEKTKGNQNSDSTIWAKMELFLDEENHRIPVFVTDPIEDTHEKNIQQLPNEYNDTSELSESSNSDDSSYTKNLIISDFQGNHKWKKQSAAGIQDNSLNDFVKGTQSLFLKTDGNGLPAFTRSEVIEPPIDLSDKRIGARVKIDDISNVKEMWFIFTSDKFSTSWITKKVSLDNVSLENNLWGEIEIDPMDSDFVGDPDLSSINQIQIRVADNSNSPIQFNINELFLTENEIASDENEISLSCNCVAFRFDDVQDFWLNEIQMKVLDVFYKNDVPLTIGVIGENIGSDTKLVNFLKKLIRDDYKIEIANHGWQHEDFATYDKIAQSNLLKQTNEKIFRTFEISPSIFIPPLNSFNNDTLNAMKENGIKYFSTELDTNDDVYEVKNSLFHFPESATTGNLNKDIMIFEGLPHKETLSDIQKSINKYGFAVVTLHPQEFSQVQDGKYLNIVNPMQIFELKSLMDSLHENDIEVVLISEINQKSIIIGNQILIPAWIKNNAGWWADKQISNEEFSESLEYLIKAKIIAIPQTITVDVDTNLESQIPAWIKNNAGWWAEGMISDRDFIKGIKFMVENKFITI